MHAAAAEQLEGNAVTFVRLALFPDATREHDHRLAGVLPHARPLPDAGFEAVDVSLSDEQPARSAGPARW